jgi:hypothetical protein
METLSKTARLLHDERLRRHALRAMLGHVRRAEGRTRAGGGAEALSRYGPELRDLLDRLEDELAACEGRIREAVAEARTLGRRVR